MSERDNPTGFTAELLDICAERCAQFGDPACWRLPDLTDPCDHITPCAECLAEANSTDEMDAAHEVIAAERGEVLRLREQLATARNDALIAADILALKTKEPTDAN